MACLFSADKRLIHGGFVLGGFAKKQEVEFLLCKLLKNCEKRGLFFYLKSKNFCKKIEKNTCNLCLYAL